VADPDQTRRLFDHERASVGLKRVPGLAAAVNARKCGAAQEQDVKIKPVVHSQHNIMEARQTPKT
jgi:hypothetical protein